MQVEPSALSEAPLKNTAPLISVPVHLQVQRLSASGRALLPRLSFSGRYSTPLGSFLTP